MLGMAVLYFLNTQLIFFIAFTMKTINTMVLLSGVSSFDVTQLRKQKFLFKISKTSILSKINFKME